MVVSEQRVSLLPYLGEFLLHHDMPACEGNKSGQVPVL